MLKLNPIINNLLSYHKAPFELTEHDEGERMVREIQSESKKTFTTQDQSEMEVLRLIRDRRFEQVKITLKNGAIKKISTEASKSDLNLDEVIDVLNSKEYQEVRVRKHNGKFVYLTQQSTIKPASKANSSRPRQQKGSAPKDGLTNN